MTCCYSDIALFSMVFVLVFGAVFSSNTNNVFGDKLQEFQIETDKINYVLGEVINFNGVVPVRLFEENNITQTPIIIVISNENHEWVPMITPSKDLDYHTSFNLSKQLGFTEGVYHVFASYGNHFKTTNFTVGKQFHILESTPKQESTFTITSDKERYAFGDRILFTGYLKNLKVSSYANLNTVNIQILDEDKKLLQSKFYKHNNIKLLLVPSMYEFNVFPRTGTGYAINQDIGFNDLKRLKPNEYRFSISITPLDFIENKTYYATATYGKNTVNTSFLVYDKFAHMTEVFEVYNDVKKYTAGDTVKFSGLAPYAVGGAGQSKQIINFDKNNKPVYQRSSSSGDNAYVDYTVTMPNGKIYFDSIKVVNGEFGIEYDLPEYFTGKNDWIFGGWVFDIEWSSHHKYFVINLIR